MVGQFRQNEVDHRMNPTYQHKKKKMAKRKKMVNFLFRYYKIIAS